MSFSADIKTELLKRKYPKAAHQKAQAYGLLRFGRFFEPDAMGIITERRGVARLYTDYLYESVGLSGSITIKEQRRGEDILSYALSVDDGADRQKILAYFGQEEGIATALLQEEGAIGAFLAGLYLACGRITDPQKNYLLEFWLHNPELLKPLRELLGEWFTPPKIAHKRGAYILYYGESEQIEDFLTAMGASKASLDLMEVKIVKEMRNKVNRVTNCETANIDKTVTAAARQNESIRFLIAQIGEEGLPEELREVARLRLENPDLSLRELCDLLTIPISRSGLNHRLRRLGEMADQYRNT